MMNYWAKSYVWKIQKNMKMKTFDSYGDYFYAISIKIYQELSECR